MEGTRYRVGKFDFAGNTVVKSEMLRPLFKIKTGDYYSQEEIRKGFQKAQEMYGAGGYTEFTGFPNYKSSATSPTRQTPRRRPRWPPCRKSPRGPRWST